MREIIMNDFNPSESLDQIPLIRRGAIELIPTRENEIAQTKETLNKLNEERKKLKPKITTHKVTITTSGSKTTTNADGSLKIEKSVRERKFDEIKPLPQNIKRKEIDISNATTRINELKSRDSFLSVLIVYIPFLINCFQELKDLICEKNKTEEEIKTLKKDLEGLKLNLKSKTSEFESLLEKHAPEVLKGDDLDEYQRYKYVVDEISELEKQLSKLEKLD